MRVDLGSHDGLDGDVPFTSRTATGPDYWCLLGVHAANGEGGSRGQELRIRPAGPMPQTRTTPSYVGPMSKQLVLAPLSLALLLPGRADRPDTQMTSVSRSICWFIVPIGRVLRWYANFSGTAQPPSNLDLQPSLTLDDRPSVSQRTSNRSWAVSNNLAGRP